MSFLGMTITKPNNNKCSLNICLCILALTLVCHLILPFFCTISSSSTCYSLITNAKIIAFTSSLISNLGRIASTSSFFFTFTSLILDAANSPSNLLLIPFGNHLRKVSKFCNELPTSYDIFNLKLQLLFLKCNEICSCLVVCLFLVGIQYMNCGA